MIRIFTRSEERVASPEELEVYNEAVSKSSIPAQVGDIKTEDLPGPGALLTPGVCCYKPVFVFKIGLTRHRR